MTAIDLTRGQCAALADYLKERVELCHQGYDLIELLVLAQRALRNASKGIVDIDLKGAPGASEAAQLKRDTLERLTAYRQREGLNSLAPLAAACGKVDEKVISADLLARMLNRERFPVTIWREVAAALDEIEREKGADTDGKDD